MVWVLEGGTVYGRGGPNTAAAERPGGQLWRGTIDGVTGVVRVRIAKGRSRSLKFCIIRVRSAVKVVIWRKLEQEETVFAGACSRDCQENC